MRLGKCVYVCAQLESWGWGSSEYVGVAKCVEVCTGIVLILFVVVWNQFNCLVPFPYSIPCIGREHS